MAWHIRLQKMVADKGWTVPELARRSGLSEASLYKYMRGDVDKPRGNVMKKLADAFGVEPIWLEHGIDVPKATSQDIGAYYSLHIIKVLSVGDIERARGRIDVASQAAEDAESVSVPNGGPRTFGIKVPDDSMAPLISHGDIVIVDPDKPALPGKIVLVLMGSESDRVLIRRFRALTGNGDAELRPENADFPTERIGKKKPGRVIGRVVNVIKRV